MKNYNHSLQVIVSRTNTIVGTCVRALYGGKFNHCSIALDNDFSKIYAFSRYYKYLWFTGCFCIEPIERYTDYVIFSIDLSDGDYNEVNKFLNKLSDKFVLYNYIGASLMLLNIPFESGNHYLCSTFVTKLLSLISNITLDKPYNQYKPMDVFNLLSNNSDVKVVS